MNINELIADCKAKGEELAGLKEEESKLREEIGQKVKANYQIFKEYYENTFLSVYTMLKDTTSTYINTCAIKERVYSLNDKRKLVIYARDYVSSPYLALRYADNGDVDIMRVDLGNYETSKLEEWSLVFGSEDKVNKLIEYFNEYFKEVLEVYLSDVIPVKLADFKSKVNALKEALSDSHTVEEKEDGTVEIRLGGKTYIGKVVEG